MRKHLPARPNLEHLRTQAKALLTRLREGDPEAAQTFAEYLPEAAKLSTKQILKRGFRLADAQAAIARKTGFAAWPGLARHVDRLRSMEGTWAFRSLEVDGQPMPSAMATTSRLLLDGDRFRMDSPEATYEGTFTIDVEQDPHFIDIDFVEGPEAGNRCEGLFQLDGGQLTLCLGLAGASRPERFATTPGSGHALEVLTRAENAPGWRRRRNQAGVSAEASSIGGSWRFRCRSLAEHREASGCMGAARTGHLGYTVAGVLSAVRFANKLWRGNKGRFRRSDNASCEDAIQRSRHPLRSGLPESGGQGQGIDFAWPVSLGRR